MLLHNKPWKVEEGANTCYRHCNGTLGSDSVISDDHQRSKQLSGEVHYGGHVTDDPARGLLRPRVASGAQQTVVGCIGSTWGMLPRLARHSFRALLKCKRLKGDDGGPGCEMTSEDGARRLLRDDLQDVEDQLHDDRALAQLTRPAVDDGDQSAVQVAQVLRQERLPVTSCQVTHLQQRTQVIDWIISTVSIQGTTGLIG